MKPIAPDRRQRGFTLLEALIAGAVFFIALVGTTLLGVSAQTNAARSMSLSQGSRVATQEMEKYAMLGYNGIGAMFDGGTLPVIAPYKIYEEVDGGIGGGRFFTVNVQLFNSRGQPSGFFADSGIPIPALGSSGVDVPSYFILVNVTWTQPNGTQVPSISQGTYVSPPNN
jgi:type II secretory pathway pseudopilin PulG